MQNISQSIKLGFFGAGGEGTIYLKAGCYNMQPNIAALLVWKLTKICILVSKGNRKHSIVFYVKSPS